MEQLLLQPVTNARRETLNGREYLVADVVILAEGVLNGSKGPLFYPSEEIGRNPGIWNGIPITNGHPIVDGRPVSARSPAVLTQYQVGLFFNDGYRDGKRYGQVWIDEVQANKVNPSIVPAILSKKPVGVSTGLFTDDYPASNGSNHNGKEYTYVARNYRPDHLAILMNEKGACSIDDGCGINLSTTNTGTTNTEGFDMDERAKNIQYLTTNCECWKGKEKVLQNKDALTDEDIKKLKENAEKGKQTADTLSLTVNSLKKIGSALKASEGATIEDITKLATNAGSYMEKKMAEDEEEEKKKAGKDKDMKMMSAEDFKKNVLNVIKEMSDKELLDNKPSLNALVKSAQEVIEEKKIAACNQLTNHITDPEKKKAALLALKDVDPKTLNVMLLVHNPTTTPIGNSETPEQLWLKNFFGGASGGPDTTNSQPTNNTPLLPYINPFLEPVADSV